jgi:hypothetical protein
MDAELKVLQCRLRGEREWLARLERDSLASSVALGDAHAAGGRLAMAD